MIKKITLLLLMISGTLSYGQNNCWLKTVTGNSRAIILAQGGTPWSWSDLGLADLNNRFVPTQINIDSDWTDVKSGLYFGSAAKNASEEIYIWDEMISDNWEPEIGTASHDKIHKC